MAIRDTVSEPRMYGVALAIAFTMLAPASSERQTSPAAPLGAGDSCAEDTCMPWTGWICIHGAHQNEGYCDPDECLR